MLKNIPVQPMAKSADNYSMQKMLPLLIALLGSWAGWWLGNQFGFLEAFLLSMLGTGVGLFYGRRLTDMIL